MASPLKGHTRFSPPKFMYTPWGVGGVSLPKFVKRRVKFEMLNFWQIISFFLGFFCTQWEIIKCTISSKPLVVARRGQKIWASWQVFSVYRVPLIKVKFSLWSFGAFPIFGDLVS